MLRRLLVIFWRVLSTAAVLLIALFIAYFLWFYHLISTSNNGFQWTVQGRYKDFELTLEQQRFSLTHSGAVAFEFRHVTPSHYYGGCLVGGEKMYRYTTYEGTSPYIQLFGSTNPQDIAEASDLAKALVGQTFAPHHIADNLGDYVWVVTVGPERPSMFGSRPPPKLLLKSYGNVEGELSDPRASKLVAQMNKWCSDANFAAQQQAMEHKRHEIAQMLESRHESLSRSGALLLEFRWDASGRNAGCLIGGDRAYLYNLQDRHMETQPIDPGEIDKLSTVAKGLLGQTFVSQPTSDPGDNSWIASIESSSVVLKRTGTFAFKGGLSDPRAQELIAVIDRWCPGANEATQRVELTQKETKFHRELSEHTAELRKNGPTFEFHYHNDAWGYVNVGCIIGDGGNVQTFDFKQEPFFQVTARVNESDYKRALSLAAPLVGQHYTSHFAGADGGNARWTITVGGSETKIKESVDTEGELTDPAAAEVVQFIAQWCPSAEGFLKFERHLRGFHPQ